MPVPMAGNLRTSQSAPMASARDGSRISATPAEMGMAYRHSDAPADWIFTHAEFTAMDGDRDAIRARMKDIVASRGDAQPRGVRTGGSTFANPAWRQGLAGN